QHTREASEPVTSSIDVQNCQNVNLTGCQIINARTRGVALHGCAVVRIADCTIRGRADDKMYLAPISVDKKCRNVMVANNFLSRGSDGEFRLPQEAGTAMGNVAL